MHFRQRKRRDPETSARGPFFWSGMRFIYILRSSATSVLLEMTESYRHRGNELQIYFWRTSQGAKVDIAINTGQGLVPI
jgi:hypothetical protein